MSTPPPFIPPSAPEQPSSEPAASAKGTQPPKKRGGCLKIALIVVGVIIALAIIGSMIGGGDDTSTTADEGSQTTPAVESTPQATPTAGETATPTPTPTKTPIKRFVYSGSGDRVVKIKKPSGDAEEPVIAAVTYRGGSNFVVWTLDQSLEQNSLLVNTIGAYKGTVAVDFEAGSATKRIQIEASGPWTIVIKPWAAARSFSGKITGKGDDVVIYTSDPKVANISHSGSGNFAIWHYTDSSSDLLINEIGKYKGQVPLTGPGLLVITASGSWTINAK